jgi:hypothetical protein
MTPLTAHDHLLDLALARQATNFDEDAQRVYLRVLHDVGAGEVKQACDYFADRSTEAYGTAMPSAGTIREKALEFRRAAATKEFFADTPATTYRCFHCLDTGYVLFVCPGGSQRTCGRPEKFMWDTSEDGKQTYAAAPCRGQHNCARPCRCGQLQRRIA